MASSCPREERYLPVEFDLDFWGGDYSRSGNIAAVPSGVIDSNGGDEERAFWAHTGIDRRHIVGYGSEFFDAEEFEDYYGFDPRKQKTRNQPRGEG